MGSRSGRSRCRGSSTGWLRLGRGRRHLSRRLGAGQNRRPASHRASHNGWIQADILPRLSGGRDAPRECAAERRPVSDRGRAGEFITKCDDHRAKVGPLRGSGVSINTERSPPRITSLPRSRCRLKGAGDPTGSDLLAAVTRPDPQMQSTRKIRPGARRALVTAGSCARVEGIWRCRNFRRPRLVRCCNRAMEGAPGSPTRVE